MNLSKLTTIIVLICLIVVSASVSYYFSIFLPKQAELERLDRKTLECKTLLTDKFNKLGEASAHDNDASQTLAYGKLLGLLDESGKSIPVPKLISECIDNKGVWLPL